MNKLNKFQIPWPQDKKNKLYQDLSFLVIIFAGHGLLIIKVINYLILIATVIFCLAQQTGNFLKRSFLTVSHFFPKGAIFLKKWMKSLALKLRSGWWLWNLFPIFDSFNRCIDSYHYILAKTVSLFITSNFDLLENSSRDF